MKDEIKEILEYVLSLTYGNENALKGVNKIQNYITNLQDTLIDKQECINAYDEIIKHRDKEIADLQKRMLEILKGENNE